LTALQRDPRQRYGTVQLFGDDLRRCLDGRPISARPHTVTYTARKAIARNPVVSAIAAAAVIVALAGGWMGVNAYLQRVELQAKQEQLSEFVATFAGKVAGWSAGAASAEKVADMRAANELLASDTVRALSERAPDPPRVKRLFNDLRDVLDRAEAASQDEPALRKEIALVYRRIGDVESRAPLPAIADKQQAARSYQRAAVIAADLRGADDGWASQQLKELSGLLGGLGSPLSLAAETSPVVDTAAAGEPPPVPEPAVSTRGRTAPAEETTSAEAAVESSLPEVDPVARAELQQRLRSTVIDAERARRNFEALRSSLASSGQTIRGNVEASLTEAEGLIEDARGVLEQNDLANAEDYLRRASYQLKRVFQAVGG
jgi:hypothetical protein